jgi:hypothetical protein
MSRRATASKLPKQTPTPKTTSECAPCFHVQEGNRVRISETDAHTGNDTDNDRGNGARPVVSEGTEGGDSRKGLSSTTFASATFASLVVLALGGALLLHPTAAQSGSDASKGVRHSAPVETYVAGALNSFNPVEQGVGAKGGRAEVGKGEQKALERVAAVVDTRPAEKEVVKKTPAKPVEQVAAVVDNQPAEKEVEKTPVEQVSAFVETRPVEKAPVEQLAASVDTKPVEKASAKPVEQVAAAVDTKKAEKGDVERGSVNPVEQVAAVDDLRPEDMVEELAMLEVAKGNRPKAEQQQQAEERSVSSETSSKLFDSDAASGSDRKNPYADEVSGSDRKNSYSDVPSFFDSGSDENPYADVPSFFDSECNLPECFSDYKPDCNVDMC